MKNLSEILQEATQNIQSHYFLLPRFEGDDILRERHYCYELYHQMRCLWPRDSEFILSGEIDKQSHNFIHDLIGSFPIPDFLIHTPGTMNNEAIIEVKTSNLQPVGIEKDIKNLSKFIEKANYKKAILLIFGESFNDKKLLLIKKIYQSLNNERINIQPIEVWLHNHSGENACHIETLEIAN